MSDHSNSSDEEVWFGKYTLKEARRDIKKYIPKTLKRRHSLSLKLSNPTQRTCNSEEISAPTMSSSVNLQGATPLKGFLDEQFNISSNPSEYLSANDSACTNNQNSGSNLIEKLTRIINEPCSQESSYQSACDQNNMVGSKADKCNETQINFAKQFEDQRTFDFKNMHQTLVENTVYLDECTSADVSLAKPKNNDDGVILLSDDSFNTFYDTVPKQEVTTEYNTASQIDSSNNHEQTKDEIDHTNSLYQNSRNSENEENIDFNPSEPKSKQDPNIFHHPVQLSTLTETAKPSPSQQKFNFAHWNLLSNISEKTEHTACTNMTELSTDTETSKMSKDSTDKEEFEIPIINFEQFDDSCNFDDTLEEMNRFLNEPSATSSKTPNVSHIPVSLPTRNVADSTEKHKALSAEKITKRAYYNLPGPKTVAKTKNIHLEIKKKSPISKKTLFTNTGAQLNTKEVFKLPLKPSKKMLTPNKPSNMFLKNVVSPVSVYINNTPKFSPLIKNSTMQKRCDKQKPIVAKKENIPLDSANNFTGEIPAVIYKASKTQILTAENEINLPGNIKKLIKDSRLIKHTRKIVRGDCNQSIERRLMEEDISIDNSLISNSDISILTNKPALILKK